MVLKFGTNVAEDWALAIFREAAKDGKLGELMVNVSSIVGIPPVVKSTDTPPTTTPTPESEGMFHFDCFNCWFLLVCVFHGKLGKANVSQAHQSEVSVDIFFVCSYRFLQSSGTPNDIGQVVKTT